jgi:hypothetical protein
MHPRPFAYLAYHYAVGVGVLLGLAGIDFEVQHNVCIVGAICMYACMYCVYVQCSAAHCSASAQHRGKFLPNEQGCDLVV